MSYISPESVRGDWPGGHWPPVRKPPAVAVDVVSPCERCGRPVEAHGVYDKAGGGTNYLTVAEHDCREVPS